MKKPSKESVRKYMEKRQSSHKPLPDMKQIRREIGWDLAEEARKARNGSGK